MEKKSTRSKILIAGPCVIEDEMMTITLAGELQRLANKYNFDYIFKSSFDKANRTSIDSYRGPGLVDGIDTLKKVKEIVGCKVTTDIHQATQAALVANVVDIIQIPAFLCRQTDLLTTAANTGKTINIKKAQFLDGKDMKHPINKIEKAGNNEAITLYECHCFLDLEDHPDTDESGEPTGIKLPYIVTVSADSNEVLAIYRNFIEADPQKERQQYFVHYMFTPGLGFYGNGLIHLLGNLSRTATANLRQLVDSGTLANMPAGFKARGLRIRDDDQPLQPGEWRDVDVVGTELRGSLLPLPYKEPSGTLF